VLGVIYKAQVLHENPVFAQSEHMPQSLETGPYRGSTPKQHKIWDFRISNARKVFEFGVFSEIPTYVSVFS
jgi:hypothetical protein